MQTLVHSIAGLLVTAAAYVVYGATIERWIEPPPESMRTVSLTRQEIEILQNRTDRQRADLAYWFSDGDWELDSPKVLETAQGRLLFHDYEPIEGGLVEIKPCTLIFLSQELKSDVEMQKRRAFVLRAPQGALLRFDAPIDLKQAKLGKLIGGELLGEVHIHSGQRLPGPEDDLIVTTRDVLLTETQITTPHLMEFRFGSHHGRGRGVIVDLDQGATANGETEVRGFRSLTLKEQVFVHLQPSGRDDVFPGGKPAAAPASTGADADKRRAPVEIRCAGPFTFDQVRNLAVFRNQVDVVRLPAAGEKDQLNGDVLTVYFESPTVDATGLAANENVVRLEQGEGPPTVVAAKKLEPRRIEVAGDPVVIRAPSNGVQARAQFVEHDVVSRMVRLRDAVEAIVRQVDREIRAPELHFLPDADGPYGTFTAIGAGRLEGASADRPQQTFAAQWSRRLFFRKHEGEYVLSAEGDARVASQGKDSLRADELHLWFREAPPRPATLASTPDGGPSAAGKKTELEPDRLLAFGSVAFESPQTTGDVRRLEAWFEPTGPTGLPRRASYFPGAALGATARVVVAAEPLRFPEPTPAGFPPSPSAPSTSVPPTSFIPPQGFAAEAIPAPPASVDSPNALPSEVPPSLGAPALPPTAVGGPLPMPASGPTVETPGSAVANLALEPVARSYHLHGELLRMSIGLVGPKTNVREAVLERDVRLTERDPANPNDIPLLLRGDRLHLVQSAPQRSHVEVTGAPAYVEARGMTMSGGKLILDRPDPSTNLLAVDGQGLMTLPVASDLQGRPLPDAETLTLTWQGRLDFDGLTARFQRGVEGRTSRQHLQTDRLDVTFDRPIPFGKSDPGPKPDLRHVACFDGVRIESRTFELGRLTSVERLTSRDFEADRLSGDFAAGGPGEVVSIRFGKSGDVGLPGAAPTAATGAIRPIAYAGPDEATAAPDVIQYLHVHFRRRMAGNQLRREMTFFNEVKVVRGPVADWNESIDEDRPDLWKKNTVMIQSDRLQVTGARDEATQRDLYDLVADGNVLVEGTSFTSRSPRLTYAQAKDMLVIEGDARTDAVLYHRKRGGDPSQTSAKRFTVWPSTDRVQVDGAGYLELSN